MSASASAYNIGPAAPGPSVEEANVERSLREKNFSADCMESDERRRLRGDIHHSGAAVIGRERRTDGRPASQPAIKAPAICHVTNEILTTH